MNNAIAICISVNGVILRLLFSIAFYISLTIIDKDANLSNRESLTLLYIRYMQNTIRRMTEQPCELPEGSTEERAAALIRVLGEIGALELLEE